MARDPQAGAGGGGMTFNLATVQELVRKYQRIQGLGKWSFTVEIVPGLKMNGQDAWAVVDSDVEAKTAHVMVRDLAKTPIAGQFDAWTELELTISHELWHPCVTELLANPTEDAEERLVENAARAVVLGNSRVMARSIQALPGALRARVVSLASRARGGQMDPKLLQSALDALIAGDLEKAAEILKGIIVASASGGMAPPAGDVAPPADGAATRMEPGGGPPGGGGDDQMMRAARAREAKAKMDDENARLRARQVAAVEETEASAKLMRTTTLRARIHEVRTIDGVTIPAEAEKLILEAPTVADGEIRLQLARGSASAQRARATEQTAPGVTAPPAPPPSADDLTGFNAVQVHTYQGMRARSPEMAKLFADETRKANKRLADAAKDGAS
jgi:hypothetical protein